LNEKVHFQSYILDRVKF